MTTKIYKLTTPHNPELIYYGSTVSPLYKRKAQHKEGYIKNLKLTSSKLFELGKDDVMITLVELCPCNTKEELTKREREYIENNLCVNKQIPGRTNKEYREQPHIKERKKQQMNTPQYKAWQKEYDFKRRDDPIRKEYRRLYIIGYNEKKRLEKLNKVI